MPKRRSAISIAGTGVGAGLGTGGAAVESNVAEMDVISDDIDMIETTVIEPEPEPVNTLFVPVYAPGVEERLERPLSITSGETGAWRNLWDAFVYADDLATMSPEDLGNLYEYSYRRLDTARRRFERERSDEARVDMIERYGALRTVENHIDPEHRFPASPAIVVAVNEFSSVENEHWSDTNERQYAELVRAAQQGREVDRDLMQRLADARLEHHRRNLMRVISGEVDPGAVVAVAAPYFDALAESGGFLGEERRGFFDAWASRARENIDSLQKRAGDINVAPNRANGVYDGVNRMESLPAPPESIPSDIARGTAFVFPSSGHRTNLWRNLEECGATPVLVLSDIPRDAHTVVFWGRSATEEQREQLAANFPSANILNANPDSNKTSMLSKLGQLAPRTTHYPEQAREWNGGRVVAKRSRNTSRGQGKEVLDLTQEGVQNRTASYDLFQEFIPNREEWRVTVARVGNEIRPLTAYKKNPPPDTSNDILAPQWRFTREDSIPAPVLDLALEGARRCGSELAGVDIIRDRDSGKYYVLETNNAPGMSKDTILRLLQEFGNP